MAGLNTLRATFMKNEPSKAASQATVLEYFDEDTNTFSYIVIDPHTSHCAVIDPVLNFDFSSGTTSYVGADRIIDYIQQHRLHLQWIIETHVHADHLSCASYIKAKLGGKIAIGENILTVQRTFAKVFNENKRFKQDGSQFDHLFADGEAYKLGKMACNAILTPGHTPACMTHVISDAMFVGDTLFMPDAGTARADFPGGNAEQLYDSTQRILSYPAHYRIFMCHDYQPNDRALKFETTVAEQQEKNIHVGEGLSKTAFVTMRNKRDKTLAMPRLILPALQVNMRAGEFPAAENNETSYLKIPINYFKN